MSGPHPVVLNRHGVLSTRAKAAKQLCKRFHSVWEARADAELAYSKKLSKCALMQLNSEDPTLEAGWNAVQRLIEAQAVLHQEYAEFINAEIVTKSVELLKSLRSKKKELEDLERTNAHRLSAAKSESVKAAEKHDRLANDLDSAVKLLGELPSSSPSYAKQFDRVQALRADIPASEQHLLDAIRLLGDVQASHDAEELRLAEEYRRTDEERLVQMTVMLVSTSQFEKGLHASVLEQADSACHTVRSVHPHEDMAAFLARALTVDSTSVVSAGVADDSAVVAPALSLEEFTSDAPSLRMSLQDFEGVVVPPQPPAAASVDSAAVPVVPAPPESTAAVVASTAASTVGSAAPSAAGSLSGSLRSVDDVELSVVVSVPTYRETSALQLLPSFNPTYQLQWHTDIIQDAVTLGTLNSVVFELAFGLQGSEDKPALLVEICKALQCDEGIAASAAALMASLSSGEALSGTPFVDRLRVLTTLRRQVLDPVLNSGGAVSVSHHGARLLSAEAHVMMACLLWLQAYSASLPKAELSLALGLLPSLDLSLSIATRHEPLNEEELQQLRDEVDALCAICSGMQASHFPVHVSMMLCDKLMSVHNGLAAGFAFTVIPLLLDRFRLPALAVALSQCRGDLSAALGLPLVDTGSGTVWRASGVAVCSEGASAAFERLAQLLQAASDLWPAQAEGDATEAGGSPTPEDGAPATPSPVTQWLALSRLERCSLTDRIASFCVTDGSGDSETCRVLFDLCTGVLTGTCASVLRAVTYHACGFQDDKGEPFMSATFAATPESALSGSAWSAVRTAVAWLATAGTARDANVCLSADSVRELALPPPALQPSPALHQSPQLHDLLCRAAADFAALLVRTLVVDTTRGSPTGSELVQFEWLLECGAAVNTLLQKLQEAFLHRVAHGIRSHAREGAWVTAQCVSAAPVAVEAAAGGDPVADPDEDSAALEAASQVWNLLVYVAWGTLVVEVDRKARMFAGDIIQLSRFDDESSPLAFHPDFVKMQHTIQQLLVDHREAEPASEPVVPSELGVTTAVGASFRLPFADVDKAWSPACIAWLQQRLMCAEIDVETEMATQLALWQRGEYDVGFAPGGVALHSDDARPAAAAGTAPTDPMQPSTGCSATFRVLTQFFESLRAATKRAPGTLAAGRTMPVNMLQTLVPGVRAVVNKFAEVVSTHCSGDAIEQFMPPLLPHDDISKRHTLVGMMSTLRSKKRDSERDAEDRAHAEAMSTATLPFRAPLVRLYIQRVNDLAHFSKFLKDVGKSIQMLFDPDDDGTVSNDMFVAEQRYVLRVARDVCSFVAAQLVFVQLREAVVDQLYMPTPADYPLSSVLTRLQPVLSTVRTMVVPELRMHCVEQVFVAIVEAWSRALLYGGTRTYDMEDGAVIASDARALRAAFSEGPSSQGLLEVVLDMHLRPVVQLVLPLVQMPSGDLVKEFERLLSAPKPSTLPSSGSTPGSGDASANVRVVLNRITARSAAACVLLHRDDKLAAKTCAKYRLLEDMAPGASTK